MENVSDVLRAQADAAAAFIASVEADQDTSFDVMKMEEQAPKQSTPEHQFPLQVIPIKEDSRPQAIIPVVQTQTVKQFEQMILDCEARRELTLDYLKRHMVEGIDYGVAYDGSKKKVLLKPGAEKIFELLKCSASFSLDKDVMEIFKLAGTPVVAWCCTAVDKTTGQVVAEGRGAVCIGEKKWLPNMVIKMSQKRAQVDCAIRLGSISSEVTQEMEQEETPEVLPAPALVQQIAPAAPRPAQQPYAQQTQGPVIYRAPGSTQEMAFPAVKKAVWATLYGHMGDVGFTGTKEEKKSMSDFIHWYAGISSFDFLTRSAATNFLDKFGRGQNPDEFKAVFGDWQKTCCK